MECVGLLSCFTFKEKIDELPKLTGPLRQMQNLLGVLERFQKKLSLKLMKLKPRWGPINHINYCEYGISPDKWSIIFTTRQRSWMIKFKLTILPKGTAMSK